MRIQWQRNDGDRKRPNWVNINFTDMPEGIQNYYNLAGIGGEYDTHSAYGVVVRFVKVEDTPNG